MTISRRVIRLILASANDVEGERLSAEEIIQELNSTTANRLGFAIELFRWEDVPPDFHEGGPQELIDDAFRIPEADIVVGIFWKRFGTGTEHEVNQARVARKINGAPHIMLYFKQDGPLPRTSEELADLARVISLKKVIEPEVLYREYSNIEEFRKGVRSDLVQKLFDFAASQSASLLGESVFVAAVSTIATLVRYQGMTEPVGDVDITLWTSREALKTTANITVFVNTNLANRLSVKSRVEAVRLLRMDQKRGQVEVVMVATMVAANAVLFASVPISFDAGMDSIVFKVNGLRVNPFQLGIGTNGIARSVAAYVQIKNEAGNHRVLNPQLIVGTSYPAFTFGLKSRSYGSFSPLQISQTDGLN